MHLASAPPIHAEIVLHSDLDDLQVEDLLIALRRLDGLAEAWRVPGDPHRLQIGFDPFHISGQEILRWFAQHAVTAALERATAPAG